MEQYVEVIGEGSFNETASRFIAEVLLEVRAANDEVALSEAVELWHAALAILRQSGISDDEIVEGGTDLHRPWYWKKQVGQQAARKIILKVKEFSRLNQALERLEPLQSRNKERKTITVTMRSPEFDASSEAKSAALASAYAEAHVKATHLASAMHRKLGKILHLEEGGWAKRSSGFSGDEDWWGDDARFARGGGMVVMGAAASEQEVDLQLPRRTIFLKCRARFELLDS